jgi:hypothetical protein
MPNLVNFGGWVIDMEDLRDVDAVSLQGCVRVTFKHGGSHCWDDPSPVAAAWRAWIAIPQQITPARIAAARLVYDLLADSDPDSTEDERWYAALVVGLQERP